MDDILLVSHFTVLPGEYGNNRIKDILSGLERANKSFELVTSSFSHQKKIQRDPVDDIKRQVNYKITLLYEPGYKKNVSIKRLFSHYIMSRNLKKYLKTREIPTSIYCAVPSLSLAHAAARYAKKNKVKFVIDVIDIWPEAFKLVFKFPIISDIIFYPMKKTADFIYSQADEIIAVSDTYSKRALKSNKKIDNFHTIFLGTDLKKYDSYALLPTRVEKPKEELWLAYVGTLGHSYDIKTVINALDYIGDPLIKFIIMGDGPLKSEFEQYAANKNANVLFTGGLPYEDMVILLKQCDIVVNPISRGAAQSIIYKHADYASSGLPVLNTQECIEYRNLIDTYNIGLNCLNSDYKDLAKNILILKNSPKMRDDMGRNGRKLAEELFDRNKTYKTIIDLLVSK